MPYREETERLRARVRELEAKLDAANRRVAQLSAHGPRPHELIAGGPLMVVHEVTLEGELPEAAREELTQALRRRFGVLGRSSSDQGQLTWSTDVAGLPSRLEVSVANQDGKTIIRGSESTGNILGLIVVTSGLVVLGGWRSYQALGVSPYVVLAGLAVTLFGARLFYSFFVGRREQAVSRAIRELADIARAAIAASPVRERVRVEPEEAEETPESELPKDVERARRMR